MDNLLGCGGIGLYVFKGDFMKYLIITILSIFSVNAMAQLAAPVPAKKVKTEVKSDIDYSPIRIDQTVIAGQKIVQKMLIRNNSDEETIAQIEILKVLTLPDGEIVLPKKMKKGQKVKELPFLEKGIFTETPSFKLKAKESKEVSLNITTTKENKGTYFFIYGVVAVPNVNISKSKKNLLSGGVGFKLNVYSFGSITIKDTEVSKIEISNISQFSSSTNKINVISSVKNTGNNYLKELTATAVLISPNQEVLSKITLSGTSEKINSTPSSTKQFKGFFQGISTKGKHQIIITIKDKDNKIIETKKEELSI